MRINHDYLNLPLPLQINFDLVPGDHRPVVRAQSPAWPDITGEGHNVDQALESLLPRISDRHRLKTSCIAALRAAGHDESTIAAWSTHIAGYRLSALRNDGEEAVDRLERYAASNINPTEACHFLGIGIGPHRARTLRDSGIGPDVAEPYSRRLGDFWADYHGEYVPCITAVNEHEIVQWTMSEFDPDQAAFYEQASINPASAQTWHESVEKHHMSARDLRDIIAAGYSPDDVEARATRDSSGAFFPAEAARTVLALKRPASGGSWSAHPDSPWGEQDPPF